MSEISKSTLRGHIRAARSLMDDAGKQAAAAAFASVGVTWAEGFSRSSEKAAVCAYISFGNEPDTGPLLAALVAHGFEVFVPVCEADYRLSWVQWTPGVAMNRSIYAPVDEPVGRRALFTDLERVECLFLPALAVDAAGTRLGQGGGYYDRFLASLSAPESAEDAGTPPFPTVGVVYKDEFLTADSLPRNSYDQPLSHVMTPSKITFLPL